jgi:D-arabinose 5-phosphate isomerase GutQ
MDKESIYEFFKTSYNLQIQELQANINNIKKDSLLNAIDIILNCKGKLACSGMGKSGLIAQKLAATFSSLGTPAFFFTSGRSTTWRFRCIATRRHSTCYCKKW